MHKLNNMIGNIEYKTMNVVDTDTTADKENPTIPLWMDKYANIREELEIILKKHLDKNCNKKEKINFVKFATGFNNNIENEAMSETDCDSLQSSDPDSFF